MADEKLEELLEFLAKIAQNLTGKKENTLSKIEISRDHDFEKIVEKIIDTRSPCTCDARVMCTNAIQGSAALHIIKDTELVHTGNKALLNRLDIELNREFAGCIGEKDKKCNVDRESIEWESWQDVDESSDQGEDQEGLDWSKSYMICTRQGGVIYFEDNGQEVKKSQEKLLKEYEYRKELRDKGFPDGYIRYLEALHKEHSSWVFEPVITNVDYQEFLAYQVDNKIKCAQDPKYQSNEVFQVESQYMVATEDAVRYFSHPYSLLQILPYTENLNILQFLDGKQELPEELVDEIVDSVLRDYDQTLIEAVKNSNTCVNPVFMACIILGEGGPNGKKYNGQKVYNLFNMGANGGLADSLKYAYDKTWFTEEACINGSDEVFQSYLDRGQDTLYSLDWDYQAFVDNREVKQYATLVNDAENKAINLQVKDHNRFVLDYELIFNIPVYENIPEYSDEEPAFPDPNHL